MPTTSPTMVDLSGFDGIWLVPGSPSADDEAVLRAIRWSREQGVPFLGTCGGLQYSSSSFCLVLGMPATHEEVDGRGAVSSSPQGRAASRASSALAPRPGSRFAALTAGMPFTGTHAAPPASTPRRGQDPPAARLGRRGHGAGCRRGPRVPRAPVLRPHPVPAAGRASSPVGRRTRWSTPSSTRARRRARYREHWQATRAREAAVAASEAEPRPYVHQMRGPRHRWWRPLLAGLVAVATWLVLAGALTAAFAVAGPGAGHGRGVRHRPVGRPLRQPRPRRASIPATFLGLWAGHRRSPLARAVGGPAPPVGLAAAVRGGRDAAVGRVPRR